jgi:cadmium resistance protein CadD (predicted permease)
MLNLLLILVLLFAVLAILLPLLEKRGKEMTPEQMQRMSRWLIPLIAIALVLQAIRYFMG